MNRDVGRRVVLWAVWVLASLSAAGCGGGGGGGGGDKSQPVGEPLPPTSGAVVSVMPGNGLVDVKLSTSIQVVFSSAEHAVHSRVEIADELGGTYGEAKVQGSTINVVPLSGLVPGMSYSLHIRGGFSEPGSPAWDITTRFSTARGRFDLPAPVVAEPDARAVAVGDVTGDGISDVLMSRSGVSRAGLLLRRGHADGTFDEPVLVDAGAPERANENPFRIEIGDLNGDGLADVVLCLANRGIQILMQTAEHTLVPGMRVDDFSALRSHIADQNGDGRADLIVSTEGEILAVWFQDAAGQLRRMPWVADYRLTRALGALVASGLSVGDLDGDGRPDLVMSGYEKNIAILSQQSDGTYSPPSLLNTGSMVAFRVFVNDIDGDGHADIAALLRDKETGLSFVGIFYQRAGQFAAPVVLPASAVDDPQEIRVVDMDADGRRDIVVAYVGNRVGVISQGRDGVFLPEVRFATRSGQASLAIGDFNADGLADLIAGSGVMLQH